MNVKKGLKKINRQDGEKLAEFRDVIKEIDYNILDLIDKRMDISKEIAEIKKRNNIEIFDQKQHEMVIKIVEKAAEEKKLEKATVKELFEKIMEMSRNKQKEIIENEIK